jgi:hypothetical protein
MAVSHPVTAKLENEPFDFAEEMRYYKARSQTASRCGGTVYAPVSKTGPARVEGSNLSTFVL